MWAGPNQNPKPKIRNRPAVYLHRCLRIAPGPLFDNRFHPDEALFSTWALKIAHGENLLLSGAPVDKPPLLLYLSALSFFVFGQSELAARVPNLIASVLSIPLLYQLTRGYWPDDRAIELPALLLALSPFAILFAPTAFLDPMMVMFGLASLVAVSRGRAGWAGILLGLSFATKVQGLFFLPLIPVFWGGQGNKKTNRSSPLSVHSSIRFALGFIVIAVCILLWDRTRGGLPFWVQQTINYGGIRVVYAGELGPRLTGWLDFLPYFFGPFVGLLGLIGLPILLYRDLTRVARTRAARIDLWLLAYTIAFLALHWLLAFPVWDRYLLILVPIAALLLGRVIIHLVAVSPCHRVSPSLLLAILLIIMLPSASLR
jgi:4-amino-4-deoxy-L-arabinose transferase-like glycosyltransferase